jgi:DNA polymerase-4
MASPRVILHVDLDAFFVAVELARDPSLRGKPVVVGGDPNGRGVVATASYEAREFGVHSALPLSTAKRLCPQAIFLRGDFPAYQRASKAFHGILAGFSPLVEPGGLDEAYIDITGCGPVIAARCAVPADASNEDLALAAADAIRRRVRDEQQLTASVGIASGRSVAKIASDAAKPDGVLLVPAGSEAQFLAPRTVRDLPGLGPKAEAHLTRLGIRTLGQLAALPEGTLRALFGSWGPDLGRRARGVDLTPVTGGRGVAKSISREGTYAQDVSDTAVLRTSLRGYAESVAADLRKAVRKARCVTLKLRYGDFTTISRSRTLEHATSNDDDLYRTGLELLNTALERDGRAVRLIGLGATQLVEDATQLDLFEPRRNALDSLVRVIDDLRAKYGHRSLQTGLTFFDPFAGDDSAFEKHTGLSSQMGLRPDEKNKTSSG